MGGLDERLTMLSSEGLVNEEALATFRGGDPADKGILEPCH